MTMCGVRDEYTIQASEVSHARAYEVVVNRSHSSASAHQETSLQLKPSRGLGRVVDRLVRGIESHLVCFPRDIT